MTSYCAPILAAALVAALSACTPVRAYERGRIAHPTMSPASGSSRAREHTHAIHEGAIGGTMGTASGCGCN